MKKALRITLALGTLAIAAQSAAQVTFYEQENFQGESFTTRRQISDFGRFGFNDSASSVVIGGETWERWEVCEDTRFNGRCAVLRPGQYPSVRAMGLNNRISSVKSVARENTPAVTPQLPAPAVSRATFYEREGLSGRSFTTPTDLADFGRNGFNDRISSVEVVGGPWEVCQDSGYSGSCVVLRPGTHPSLKAIGLDNRISSARALGRDTGPDTLPPRITFYERESFGGRSFYTQGEVADFGRAGLSDRASSVEVVGGWFEVCQGSGYSGQCVFLRPGKYPSLASIGLNNSVASVRAVRQDGRALDNRAGPSVPGLVYDPRRRDNEQLYEANVTAVRAVVGTPGQRCWVDRDRVAQEPGRSNVPATIIGAVIGGILGHQVGDGRGRDLATIGGAVAGGAIGASVGRDGRPQTEDVQRCTNMPNQASAELWDVTYNFRGQEHRVQMTNPPGSTITVNRDGEPRV